MQFDLLGRWKLYLAQSYWQFYRWKRRLAEHDSNTADDSTI